LHLSRRALIKNAGMAGAAVATGLLPANKAPVLAQDRHLHILARQHFLPEADAFMRHQLIPDFQKAAGLRVTYETIQANDLSTRITAALEHRSGPDVFQMIWNQLHLYAAGLENLDDLGAELGVDTYYPCLQGVARVDGVLRGIPYYGIGNAVVYRKDVFEEIGIHAVPETLDDYLNTGAKLKAAGWPVGQTLGHAFGDATAFCYPLLWSFGGREVDEQGNVAINAKATLQACEFLRAFWHDACDPSGLTWDDASNNRALFAETIGATLNGSSIYFAARNHPEQAPPGLADKIAHFMLPRGPAGAYSTILPLTHVVARYSRQKDVAQAFIRYLMQKERYEPYILLQKGYALGATPDWEQHPFWHRDPAIEPFRLNLKHGRNFGWAGSYNRNASEALAKFIVVDLFARTVKGEDPGRVVQWAAAALKTIYG
jgi:multiple sugar transport system substrate-binding protein